ncbi:MAG: hypothetical protein GX335_09525 [Firmicutes bacterium]|nr:hypothetical protein [Bacillota bacterium]
MGGFGFRGGKVFGGFPLGSGPQILPQFIAASSFRFEINIRAAATLGSVALIVIAGVVTVIDFSSAWIRKIII